MNAAAILSLISDLVTQVHQQAELVQQQAARIAELEAELAAESSPEE